MRHGISKSARRRRRSPDEISYSLSTAQREWLRPVLMAKLKDPTNEIPYKRIGTLALFREFRSSRRLETLIRAEMKDLQRLLEVEARRRAREAQERRQVEESREEAHAQAVQEEVRRALQAQATTYEQKIGVLEADHARKMEANELAWQHQKDDLQRQLEELGAIETNLHVQMESAAATLHAMYTSQLDGLQRKLKNTERLASEAEGRHETKLRWFSEKYEAIKCELEAERSKVAAVKATLDARQASPSTDRQEMSLLQDESSLQLMATATALRAAESEVQGLRYELSIFRNGPELETKMRSLLWACRRLPYDVSMEEVRRELAKAYVDAYSRTHRITPRRLVMDVESLVKEWWYQRCQIAHKTDHGVQLDAYKGNSKRVSTVIDEIDAVLLRRANDVHFSMGPLQFLDVP